MTPEQLQKWAEGQISELLKLGIDAIESQRSINWILRHLPPGADPRTYVFPADMLNEPLDEKAIADARTDWYSSDAIQAKYKRILDAKAPSSLR